MAGDRATGPVSLLRRLTGRARPPHREVTLLDGLEAAVFLVDPYGQPRAGNKAALELAGGQDRLAAWLYDAPFHDPGDRRALRPSDKPLARLRSDPSLTEVFTALIDAQGSEVVLRFTRGRLPDRDGWQMIHVEDGAARLHLRRSSDGADRLESIGQLSGGIAHDMSNLLGVIRLSADTMSLSENDPATRAVVSAIQAACDRGTTLIDHLLSIARREDGESSRITLAPFLAALQELMRNTIPAHIRIDLALEAPDLWLVADRGALENALLNLTINAQKAIQETGAREGQIHLGAALQGDRVALWVEDDGPGMEPAVLARAAEPFFSTRPHGGGSGLGLAMVSNFAEVSGGEIRIESQPGEGTKVSLLLPRNAETEVDGADASAGDGDTVDLQGVRLLIVEDDPLFGEVLSQALQALGAEVTLAASAAPAQQAIEAFAPDLLITDIVLPGPMNGHQLALELRRSLPELRVIYVSGYAAPSALPGDYVPGAFLRKPVSARTMANTISRSLAAAPGATDGQLN